MSNENKQENRRQQNSGGHAGGPMGISGAVEKPKNFKKSFSKLLKYMQPYYIGIIIVVIFAILSTIFAIVGPNMLGDAVTDIYKGLISKITSNGGIDFSSLSKTLTFLLILYVLSTVFGFIQGFIMNTIASNVSYKLRKDISKKINKLPMKYFDKKTHGEVLSIVTNDVDTLSNNMSQSLSQLITSIATIIGVLIMMVRISGLMTLVTLLILPISIGGVMVIVKRSQKYFKQQQDYLGNVNGVVEEVYGGHEVVQAFNGEEKALENFNKYNDKLASVAWKSQFMSSALYPLMNFVGNLSYVVVSILGGYLAVKNKITVGNIVSFTQYVRNFNQPIAQLAQISSMIQSTVAAAERVFEFLDEKEEVKDVANAVSTDEVVGNIEFKDVNFGYNENQTIINDFNAKVKQGQKIAIVGPTGAGKTTMVKLLMRFYDINKGQIIIDGHDIKEYKRGEIRSQFGMVLQDTWLFSGTIADNIRYGKLDASIEEVKDACRAASVHHFIKTLPDTYDMVLNEESDNISQGQKQLLTIARVILADPKILILDEATSSVDTRTEILIQKAMDKLMEGRTSFIIAHRLSTIKNADLILVMDKGDIVETGTHNELLKKGGFYANLYNSQFEETEI